MKTPFRLPSPSFTLVEILAATAVLSILFSIMFSILQQTSKGWQAANRRVEASQVARLALDQIASDLENCVAVAQGGLVPGTNNRPFRTNYGFGFFHSNAPPMNQSWLPASINISEPNDFIFVVTPYNPSQNLGTGDLCEVGYIPIFVATSNGYSTMRGGRYVLLRHMPMTNGAGNQTVTNAQPLTDFLRRSADWESTTDLQGRELVTTTQRLPFVDNCVKFDIKFIYTNAQGIPVTSDTWGRPTVEGTNIRWVGNPGGFSGLPLAADIQMCVIDDKAAERIWRLRGMRALDKNEKTNIPANWAAINDATVRRILQESVLTLERRVFFKNSGK